jgi:hypothetical protein
MIELNLEFIAFLIINSINLGFARFQSHLRIKY